MRGFYVKAGEFWLEDKIAHGGYLEVKNGVFGEYFTSLPGEQLPVVDVSNYIVAPGLFDTHIHGIAGYDVMDGTSQSIQKISKILPSLGVTRFLPTTLSGNMDTINKVIQSISLASKEGGAGAVIEGIFLEGPYFTEKHKGAQNSYYFCDPSVEELEKWLTLSDDKIKKIALAPERKGAIAFIEAAVKRGITISLAHTDADFSICQQAVEKGASVFVHLYNGMSGLHHRAPGVVGAALRLEGTYSEIICDGYHVDPNVVVITSRMLKDRMVLITDCMRAGLLPDGTYKLGEYDVHISNGKAETSFGSLAGSTLILKDGVKKVAEWTGMSLYEAWHHASLSPAKSVRLQDKIGSIRSGKCADFVIMDPNLQIKRTVINGETVYKKE
ncbi:N-acetylglucosamine-6-phosphate deacetylase [Evansella vedderi]|uniref:N-acetylglucosamine-6-phosphate deacetylase n=1 Tax=Evansella vedderi TaxID=38282 RepID=A0ABT9ZPF4_9BACI|nr:N-acetylglucosamine-6-phosphate deacetylase [Evansella vedderi]MDQ0252729.1 N-acetylglucosamine-6-phosphate deacetylase [Evansella vedderi]